MLFIAILWAINWFRPRRVPDSIQEHSGIDLQRRQLAVLAAQISLFALGTTILPGRNLGSSFLASAQKNPRYRKRKHRPSAGYKTERMVEENLRAKSITPHDAYEQLCSALLKEPHNLRLYDRIAALTVQFNLIDQRLLLVEMAQRAYGEQANSRRSTSPLPLGSPLAGPRPLTGPSKHPYYRRNLWERILTGVPDYPQKGKRAKKCSKKGWVSRNRKHSKPSFESLLQKRVERWVNPNSQWIKKWSEHGPRTKRGWLLPNPVPPGKLQCPPRA
jgi:hypothetical protein